MLYVSILTSDRERDPELWATIWNGEAPPSLNLIGAYNLGSDQRVFIWEGESVADVQFMDRFNEIGVLETRPAFDRTDGWRMCFAKDLERFSQRPRRPGMDPRQFEAGIDLRRRGMTAPNREAARAAARVWQEEQAQA
ncbi:MAG: hypothetical protein BZY88_00575 [SAR202 cluster bacterium Io17-Chloro-G9]|nr:MAG: hypothetical protein BZY88_00575 [SAR202 cluster bacterium Io17-Chloro-G9]